MQQPFQVSLARGVSVSGCTHSYRQEVGARIQCGLARSPQKCGRGRQHGVQPVGEICAGILLGPPLADFVPLAEAWVLLGEIGYVNLEEVKQHVDDFRMLSL